MHAFHSIGWSALLLAASVPAFAVTAGDAAQASAAPAAPAIQVAPGVPAPAPTAAVPAVQAPTTAASQGAAPALGLPGAAALGGLADPQTLALLESLGALQVTPQQALGGVGAMLGLAQSRLGAGDYAQLAGAVPGLPLLAGTGALGALGQLGGLGGLFGNAAPPAQTAAVDSQAALDQRFSALGMAPSLVGQFAPILLQFLGGQGVAATLLQSLGGIWGVPATPALTQPVAVGS